MTSLHADKLITEACNRLRAKDPNYLLHGIELILQHNLSSEHDPYIRKVCAALLVGAWIDEFEKGV